MAGIIKGVVRVGVITALVGGVVAVPAVLIAGPDRVLAVVTQARQTVNQRIDKNVKDPIALRAQLRDLEAQYPKRIADVRSDLSELRGQVSGLERELAVSRRVVELAQADLDGVQSLLARAEQARGDGAEFRVVKIRFGNDSLQLDQAYSKASQIADTRDAFVGRVADLERDLGFLGQQEQRLTELLAKLETERAEFQSQLWQLDRQVDAIARNDRMIEMMEKRQHTIDEQSRYRVASLDQLHARLADIRANQEATLQALAGSGATKSYEDRAKYELDAAAAGLEKHRFLKRQPVIEIEPPVIEIGPEDQPAPKITASRDH